MNDELLPSSPKVLNIKRTPEDETFPRLLLFTHNNYNSSLRNNKDMSGGAFMKAEAFFLNSEVSIIHFQQYPSYVFLTQQPTIASKTKS